MTRLTRWWKFNLVGTIGTAVQLFALAFFSHRFPGHYMVASAVAIELTLLHNFTWHVHFTWRDRHKTSALRTRLLRFHLSNGLMSMTGNLILIRFLVQTAHLPLLVANSIAILCCSLINFGLGDRWAFADRPAPLPLARGTEIPGLRPGLRTPPLP